MAQAEQPERLHPQYKVSVDDVRQLMGASTPHFALQLRNRIRTLIAGLPEDDPARRLGEGYPYWITLTESKAEQLREWVRSSKRIAGVAG